MVECIVLKNELERVFKKTQSISDTLFLEMCHLNQIDHVQFLHDSIPYSIHNIELFKDTITFTVPKSQLIRENIGNKEIFLCMFNTFIITETNKFKNEVLFQC